MSKNMSNHAFKEGRSILLQDIMVMPRECFTPVRIARWDISFWNFFVSYFLREATSLEKVDPEAGAREIADWGPLKQEITAYLKHESVGSFSLRLHPIRACALLHALAFFMDIEQQYEDPGLTRLFKRYQTEYAPRFYNMFLNEYGLGKYVDWLNQYWTLYEDGVLGIYPDIFSPI